MPIDPVAAVPLTRDDLEYELPPELIAQHPSPERTGSRLLSVDRGAGTMRDMRFHDLGSLLSEGDLLVLNDTRVFRARLLGCRKDTGGRAEVFLLKKLEGHRWRVLLRPSKRARPGSRLSFSEGLECTVLEELDRGRAVVEFQAGSAVDDLLERTARVPLPPYIRRDPEELDDGRYQTVYASSTGAVAAPTAGLHFDRALMGALEEAGIGLAYVTLHVGPGTFEPLRHHRLEENRLDPEEYSVPESTLEALVRTRRGPGRIVAVGTTTTRVLETLDLSGECEKTSGETGIFIFPPYRFRNVDALLTNFHLPGSSLLCLVAAFLGYEPMMEAYRHAVRERYRFYSYGDAMFIE